MEVLSAHLPRRGSKADVGAITAHVRFVPRTVLLILRLKDASRARHCAGLSFLGFSRRSVRRVGMQGFDVEKGEKKWARMTSMRPSGRLVR